MATKISVKDVLNDIDKELVSILEADFRTSLDSRITILDLSKTALQVNIYRSSGSHVKAFDFAYDKLVEVLNEKATRQYSSLNEVPEGYFTKKHAPFIYINGGDSNRFLVAPSFGSIQKFMSTVVSKDPRLLKTSFGSATAFKEILDENGRATGAYTKTSRVKYDIGHIPAEGNENLTSPLEEKLLAILNRGLSSPNAAYSNIVAGHARKAMSDLYEIQASAAYSFKNAAPESIEAARSTLGSGYVVVTLHRTKLNAAFSKIEAKILRDLKASLALKLGKVRYEAQSGSNTIVEDIEQYLLYALSKGTKVKKPNKHKTNKVTSTRKAKPNVQVKTSGIATTPLRNINTGRFQSLTSLQALINANLAQKIKENMGNGSRRDILNLRTGRLAESANVERMSQSRAGMITAFYSYMKNPYATFSDGGKQQDPKSRDPKLLISKSIREIAAAQVANRMRAVLV